MGLLERETVPGVCRASPVSQTKPITPDSTNSMISLRFQSEGRAQKWEKEKCPLSGWKLFSQHCDFSWELEPAMLSLHGRAAPRAGTFPAARPPLPGCCCFCAVIEFKIRCFCFPVVSGSLFGTDMTGLRQAEKSVTSSHFGNVSPVK